MFKLKQISNHKIFILILVIVFIGLGIYFILSATNGSAVKNDTVIITNDDVEITVSGDSYGMQQETQGLQNDVANPNLGAATIQEIGGGNGNPAQGANLDEILKDKEIEIGR